MHRTELGDIPVRLAISPGLLLDPWCHISSVTR